MLHPALQALVLAIQDGGLTAEARASFPVISRLFMHEGVHLYYRCVIGSAVQLRALTATVDLGDVLQLASQTLPDFEVKQASGALAND